MARSHRLKTWPEYFEAIASGAKTFEVRRDDRGFAVGDMLVLEEWDPSPEMPDIAKGYTGRILKRLVSYKLPGGKFGLDAEMCVLALATPPLHQRRE